MMSEEKRLTDKELDGLDNLLDDIAIGRGNIEGVQALFLRWGNDLLEEVRQLRRDLTAAQETIAAKDGEIERWETMHGNLWEQYLKEVRKCLTHQ